MKRLTSLLQYVLDESGTWCRTSTTRDIQTIASRIEHEGDSFLTITLPNFGKDFEKSLDQGKVDPSFFLGFERKGELPVFLGGFLDLVFDRSTGLLLSTTGMSSRQQALMIVAIRCIRQITLLHSKLLEPCSPKRRDKAIRQYLECDRLVANTSWLEVRSDRRFAFDATFPASFRRFQRSVLHIGNGPYDHPSIDAISRPNWVPVWEFVLRDIWKDFSGDYFS